MEVGSEGWRGWVSAGCSSLQRAAVLGQSCWQDKGTPVPSGAEWCFHPIRKWEGAEIPQETLLS